MLQVFPPPRKLWSFYADPKTKEEFSFAEPAQLMCLVRVVEPDGHTFTDVCELFYDQQELSFHPTYEDDNYLGMLPNPIQRP